jgi:hypothetical protein
MRACGACCVVLAGLFVRVKQVYRGWRHVEPQLKYAKAQPTLRSTNSIWSQSPRQIMLKYEPHIQCSYEIPANKPVVLDGDGLIAISLSHFN